MLSKRDGSILASTIDFVYLRKSLCMADVAMSSGFLESVKFSNVSANVGAFVTGVIDFDY